MTAPAAPVIRANQDGHMLYARWRPVTDAVSYNVYVAEGLDAAALAATALAAEVALDGWFLVVFGPYAGPVAVTVKAVNAGAEESEASNAVRKILRGMGAEPKAAGPRA
jgi:hypothetical protein